MRHLSLEAVATVCVPMLRPWTSLGAGNERISVLKLGSGRQWRSKAVHVDDDGKHVR